MKDVQVTQLLTGCIPLSTAAERYHMKPPTLRRLIRENIIPGIKIKPYQVHEESLVAHLTEKSNDRLKKLYSSSSGTVSGHMKGCERNDL